jgi:hypothetical protein
MGHRDKARKGLEVRDQTSEDRRQEAGDRRQEIGDRRQEAGDRRQGDNAHCGLRD